MDDLDPKIGQDGLDTLTSTPPKHRAESSSAFASRMNPLKIVIDVFRYLFKKKATPPVKRNEQWAKGYNAFERGKEHYFAEPMRAQEALDCFDIAIGCKYEDAEVYHCRGKCLQELNFHLEAIEDYNMAISLGSEDVMLYSLRAFSKTAVGDWQGCVSDLQEAVRLSKVDNALNRAYDLLAKETGRGSATAHYQMELVGAELNLRDSAREKARKKLSLSRRRLPGSATGQP